MGQNAFDLVRLLDLDAHADGVHRRLDEYALVLISRDRQGIEEDLKRRSYAQSDASTVFSSTLTEPRPLACCASRRPDTEPSVVCIGNREAAHLRREVLKGQCCSEGGANSGEVGSEDVGLGAVRRHPQRRRVLTHHGCS